LLPTIRSRCQRVAFGLLPPEFVARQLGQRLNLPAADAEALARLAGGRLGAALRWHRAGLLDAAQEAAQSIARLERGGVTRFSQELIESGTALAARLAQADSQQEHHVEGEDAEDSGASEGGGDEIIDEEAVAVSGRRGRASALGTSELRDALKLVLMLVAAVYRDALLLNVGGPAALHLAAQRPLTESISQRASAAHLHTCIRAVAHAERMLVRNVTPALVGEFLGAALVGAAPVPIVD
jgi:hypothetical protein